MLIDGCAIANVMISELPGTWGNMCEAMGRQLVRLAPSVITKNH
jgi:hypothetical protein